MSDVEGPKRVTKIEWAYDDIAKFVKEVWGIKWEGAAAMGFPAQSTYHDIEVTGGYQEVGYDSEGIEREALWMDEGHDLDEARALIEKVKREGMPREEYASPGLELVLNMLAYSEYIPTGDYRVTVDW